MRLRWCALVLVASCSSHAVSPDAAQASDAPGDAQAPGAYQSGTRLKIQRIAIGGTTVPILVLDTQLGFTCGFRTFADGKTYCAPGGDQIVYADQGCTQPLVMHDPGPCAAPAASFALDIPDVDFCGNAFPTRVVRRGDAATIASYYERRNTGCVGPISPGASAFFAPGEDVTNQLAEITTSHAPGADRLVQRVASSADGMRIPDGAYDTKLASDCGLSAGPDVGTAACEPFDAVDAGYFQDASCTTPEIVIGASCSTPSFGANLSVQCGALAESYSTVKSTSAAPVYYGAGASCTAVSFSLPAAYYLLDSPAELASLPRGHDATTSRLAPTYFDEGATQIADGTLFDATLQHECVLQGALDGTWRCLPAAANVVAYYGDPGCQTELDLVDVPIAATGCDPTPVPVYAARYAPGDACPQDPTIYVVADAFVGTVYAGGPGSCQEVDDPSVARFRLGTPVTDLATGTTITTDP